MEKNGFLRLRGIEKEFKTEAGVFKALKRIDLSVDRGEYLALVGRSGSGKTTLLNMITGIDRPSAGEIRVGGEAIHAMKESRLAAWRGKNVGIVFQFFQLMPTLSVLENVMLPMDFLDALPWRDRKKRAQSLLERFGVAEQGAKLPHSLSGGQQQRAAIARALANDPELLVADEPTGNLDSKTAEGIFAAFKELSREGKTVILVTHEKSMGASVDRSLTIHDGSLTDEDRGQDAGRRS
jgi:putative ABC transport system ATP-binding protein